MKRYAFHITNCLTAHQDRFYKIKATAFSNIIQTWKFSFCEFIPFFLSIICDLFDAIFRSFDLLQVAKHTYVISNFSLNICMFLLLLTILGTEQRHCFRPVSI